ncbi:MAG: GNAT family N-acetyltransferase [Thermoplasmatota archaeon]
MDEGKVIISSELVILRDAKETDIDNYVKWMNEGEWRNFDAPWEKRMTDIPEEEIKVRFLELYLSEREEPRRRVIIADKKNRPIGWINRYYKDKYKNTWLIGIDICEDEYLGKGYGTESLKLWIEYLFRNSKIDDIGLKTYSFNDRMIRVAEKLGMEERGVEIDFVEWKGEKFDRVFYSISRDGWKSQKQ